VRIVAGKYRGRRLRVPPGSAVRPTADRARETLFNVLAHGGWGEGGLDPVQGATVLDAFAGCGALGIEALSRGARRAHFLDSDRDAVAVIRANLDTLGTADSGIVRRANALKPPPAPRACDLVFLDPPYGEGLAAPALAALAEQGWIAPGALAVAEVGADEPLTAPAGFDHLRERRAGPARFVFLRKQDG